MFDFLPIAAILVLGGFLGARKGARSQFYLLAVMALAWLVLGLGGSSLVVGFLPVLDSLLRGRLRGEGLAPFAPQPDLLPAFNAAVFILVLAAVALILWRKFPIVAGLWEIAKGAFFGILNSLLASLFLFRLNQPPLPSPTFPQGEVGILRLQTPQETTLTGLPPLVVMAILLIIFLAVRAIQPPRPGPGPYET